MATPSGDISVYVLKLTMDVHLSTITKHINLSMRNGCSLMALNQPYLQK